MDFTEFKRRLGAEPGSQDPGFLRARTSSPEFRQAAEAADRFEAALRAALNLPTPDGLLADLQAVATGPAASAPRRRTWGLALAAGLLLAFGAGVVYRQQHPPWNTVEEYVAVHFQHDGRDLLAQHNESAPAEVNEMLARYGIAMAPGLASQVMVVKACPTPDGKGVHMVLDTGTGLMTVIVMPNTGVADGERLAFDGQQAVLVALQRGSAAIVGTPPQDLAPMASLVQASILPVQTRT